MKIKVERDEKIISLIKEKLEVAIELVKNIEDIWLDELTELKSLYIQNTETKKKSTEKK